MTSGFHPDTGVVIHEQLLQPFPEPRSDREVLISIADLLERLLGEIKHVRAALGATGSVTSVEIDTDSKGQTKPHVKVYDLDPERANAEAQRIYDELVVKYTPPFGASK